MTIEEAAHELWEEHTDHVAEGFICFGCAGDRIVAYVTSPREAAKVLPKEHGGWPVEIVESGPFRLVGEDK